jgi:hypothetical protein
MKTRRRSRLPVSTQKRLLEHFVAGTNARSAADLVGVNRNTATVFYRKLRETIQEHIAEDTSPGKARWKSMRAISVASAEASEAAAPPVRSSSSVC